MTTYRETFSKTQTPGQRRDVNRQPSGRTARARHSRELGVKHGSVVCSMAVAR
jgi:hypothetical protein